MHKKLASDLTSLAHDILQIKNKEDVFELKQKAYEVYEKLSVLAYIEEYINNTPNPSKTKQELLHSVLLAEENRAKTEIEKINSENSLLKKQTVVYQLEETVEDTIEQEIAAIPKQELAIEKSINEVISKEEPTEEATLKDLKEVQQITEKPLDEIEHRLSKANIEQEEVQENALQDVEARKNKTLEEELHGTISVDVMTDLFEKVTPKKSLNDFLQSTIQIDLNDRIVFVRHLFDGNQNDFNRVLSQLNTFKTEKEAKRFINKMIKPEYDWSGKEIYEARLFEIIERRFS